MLDVTMIVLSWLPLADELDALLLVVRDNEVANPMPEDVDLAEFGGELVPVECVAMGDGVEIGRLVMRHEHADEIFDGELEHLETYSGSPVAAG